MLQPGFGRGFAGLRANPYPVRAALDIGTGGCITGTVARVDAEARAIRDILYHDTLPIDLIPANAPSSRPIDPASWVGISNALRMMVSSLSRFKPCEYAGIVTLDTAGSNDIVCQWESEHRIRLHAPRSSRHPAGRPAVAFHPYSPFAVDWDSQYLERIALYATAAAAACTAPSALLTLREEDGDVVECMGIDDSYASDSPSSLDRSIKCTPLRHRFSFGAESALLNLLHLVQRRPNATADSSPNPCTANEFRVLTATLSKHSPRDMLPSWVTERLETDSPVVAYGPNGGVWNIAARVCGRHQIGLDALELSAQHALCGLTDILLAENFPNPRLVVPQVAVAAAVLRSLSIPRVTYLVDIALSYAVLVEDGFWTYSKAADLHSDSSVDAVSRQRFFAPPRPARFDPSQAHRTPSNPVVAAPRFTDDERQWNRKGQLYHRR